jgi:oligoribonuclease NrnB/cAMP/cGMP phosphodiesterase (DHH superfamily)
MSNVLCIYHKNCLDGFTSAWIVNSAIPECEFYAATYHDTEYPDVTDKVVYIVDFTYKREVLINLAKKASSIIILDHHESAKNDLKTLYLSNVKIIFDMNKSGAMLTWDYLYPDIKPPLLVDFVQDYDLWKYKLQFTEGVIAAIYSYDWTFELFDTFTDNYVTIILYAEGKSLVRDNYKICNTLIKHPQILNIGGYKIPAINCSGKKDLLNLIGNKLAFNAPFGATYYINSESRVIFSLRTNDESFNKVDVTKIAKPFGGGGHKTASGFGCSIDQLLEFMR